MDQASFKNVEQYMTNLRHTQESYYTEGGHGTKRVRQYVSKDIDVPSITDDTVKSKLDNMKHTSSSSEWDVIVCSNSSKDADHSECDLIPCKDEGTSSNIPYSIEPDTSNLEPDISSYRDEQIAKYRANQVKLFSSKYVSLLLLGHRFKAIFRASNHPLLFRLISRAIPQVLDLIKICQEILFSNPLVTIKPTLKPTWIISTKYSSEEAHSKYTRIAYQIVLFINKYFHPGSTLSANSAFDAIPGLSYNGELTELYTLLEKPEIPVKIPHLLYFSVLFVSIASKVRLSIKRHIIAFDMPMQSIKFKSTVVGNQWCWCEVYCPERKQFISINPLSNSKFSVMWNAEYCLAFSGSHVVDVTPRYTNIWSKLIPKRIESLKGIPLGYLWSTTDPHPMPTLRGITEATMSVTKLCSDLIPGEFIIKGPGLLDANKREWIRRECRQMGSLKHSETLPTTLKQLHKHPLYIVDSALHKFETVHPMDKTTCVGIIKNQRVFKRESIVPLLSRTGWLRYHRVVGPAALPAKSIQLDHGPVAKGPVVQLYGHWQTEEFRPLPPVSVGGGLGVPLCTDGAIKGGGPHYLLLDCPVPEGLAHLKEPGVDQLAHRMGRPFGHAVVGFKRPDAAKFCGRRARWAAVVAGAVVLARDARAILAAHSHHSRAQALRAASRRRARARLWWRRLAQQILTAHRIQHQYGQ